MNRPFDKIEIEFIPHAKQRYSTCGDWHIVPGLDAAGKPQRILLVSVSMDGDWRSEVAVGVHEVIEAILCAVKHISVEQVDAFDMQFEKERKPGDESEPGDAVDAPYRDQHGIASGVERILAANMGLPWSYHEKAIGDLFDK